MSFLSVENLTLLRQQRRRHWFQFDLEENVLIDDVSFQLEKTRCLGLVGEEQSGKFALTLALLKLHEVEAGTITFAEVDTTSLGDRHFRRLRKRIQAVFSDGFGQLTPSLTVDQIFSEVLQLWYGQEGREQWQHRIESVMVACGLPEAIRVLYPAELDAVERQQVALARALLPRPWMLISHGFTQGLDAVEEAELLNLLMKVREDFGLTMLVTTDDLAVAHHLSDDIGVLHRGKLLEFGAAEAVVSHPAHDYTRRLVSCSL
tara:strand:+ start:2571 stop:3353 length:783 start_codon:yes stop_codon:yes gene_type:complete